MLKLAVALSILGTGLLAVFTPRALSVGASIFADPGNRFDIGQLRLIWAAIGGFTLAFGESIYASYGRKRYVSNSTSFNLFVVGRALEVIGVSIALFSLFSSMAEMRSFAMRFTVLPEVVSENFHRNWILMTAGLWLTFFGQLVFCLGISRLQPIDEKEETQVKVNSSNSGKAFPPILKLIWIVLFVGPFILAAIFENALIDGLQSTPDDVALIIFQSLQGMMVYPFIGFTIYVLYCFFDSVALTFREFNPS